MQCLPDKTISLFGRQYDLAFGRGERGGTWLLLVNRQTQAVFPVTAIEMRPGPLHEVHLADVDQIVPTLEAAGIIRRIGPSEAAAIGLPMCRCEIIHPDVLKGLQAAEAERASSLPAHEHGIER